MPCSIEKNLSQHPNRKSELITSGGGLLFLWLKRIEDMEKRVNADDVVSYIWYVVKCR